jgi:hypothetical protein
MTDQNVECNTIEYCQDCTPSTLCFKVTETLCADADSASALEAFQICRALQPMKMFWYGYVGDR